MKNLMQLTFNVDQENKRILVTREFNGPLSTVWAAWTQAELLDQWWAPKPWKARTLSMNFTVGGAWRYSMNGPEGEVHWARADFSAITPQKEFKGLDSFTDKDGNINEEFPKAKWHVSFSEKGETTIVSIVITYDKVEDLNKYIEMGFKEGFTLAMENLDDLLEEKG
jgi:uncharacterized protein YndB with AHSA1/START domain